VVDDVLVCMNVVYIYSHPANARAGTEVGIQSMLGCVMTMETHRSNDSPQTFLSSENILSSAHSIRSL
jgi:hypothetical protein